MEKRELMDIIKKSVKEVDYDTYKMQCIVVAVSIYQQVKDFGYLAGVKPEDLVLKSIPTNNPNEFIHVWVELDGVPIDPFLDDLSEEGDEIREAVKKAEAEGTVQENNQLLMRAIL